MEDAMSKSINKKKLREFFFRRRLNFLTLLVITLMSVIITIACRVTHFIPDRMVILELVTALLVVLCLVQSYRMRRSFRTMKSFKGKRKKKSIPEEV